MNQSDKIHRQAVKDYFSTLSGSLLRLSISEYEVINNILKMLYKDIGSVSWIKTIFMSALDAYWKINNIPDEVAVKCEGSIGSYMQRTVTARQFHRLPDSAIKIYISIPAANTSYYWHNYKDPYPPPNIEELDEPYHSFFLILDDLVRQMETKGNPSDAVIFLATILAAFAQTYPIGYLSDDGGFQTYVKNEVGEKPVDDDYTYYLCRMLDYKLLDRY
jgi:hypothetical protein